MSFHNLKLANEHLIHDTCLGFETCSEVNDPNSIIEMMGFIDTFGID